MGFGDSRKKRQLDSRLSSVVELRTDGRTQEARVWGEQVLEDAEALVGPDDRITLYAREELALTYFDDDPQRARELLEQLVPDYERVFGRDSMEGLTLRCQLPGTYGLIGDHENARALAATLAIECERELGEDHPHTQKMRETVATAERELAQGALVNLLSAKWTTDGLVPDAEAQEARERCAVLLASARSHRLVARMQPLGGGADWLEWQAALTAGVVEATQVFYEDRAELLRADWITTPKREYQIVPPVDGAAEGVVANVEGVRHGDVNDALQATSFAELLAVSPVRTSAAVIGERRYVVLQYERPPAAVLRWLARGENRTTGLVSTRLWLDAETAELVRAETELPVEALSTSAELFQFRAVEFEEHRRNVEIVLYRTDRGLPAREGSVELTQVFGSYGDEIVIDEPHSEGVFELHETP
jgi:hypothetical protein